MKKPPPSRLHQQEPSYQSPPQPLYQQEPSYQSPTRPPPPLHQQEPSQEPRRRGPVITYIPTPRIFHTPSENFKSLVQRLTGKPPTSTTPSSSSPYMSAQSYTSAAFDESPATEMYAELEKTKPRPLGFVGGLETTDQYHHHHHNQWPNLSPGSSSLWTELYSTTSPQGLFVVVLPYAHFSTISLILEMGQEVYEFIGPSNIGSSGSGSGSGHSYLPWDEDRGIPHSVNDTTTIGSDYDMYLRNLQTPSLPSEELGRFNGGGGMGRLGVDNHYIGDELMPGHGGVFPSDFGPDGFSQPDLVGGPSRELLRLPPDASNSLFVEGLPSDCSMREIYFGLSRDIKK
ncbi:hypothetical protein Bca101_053255 [Brassica carinata]